MAESCSHNCDSCGSNCSSRTNTIPKTPLKEGCSVKKVIGVVSGKGGVGKSLVTSLLASQVQRNGFQAAVLDADITGPSIPNMFGVHRQAVGSQEGIEPLLTETGVQMISVNNLLDNETDPVIWRGPVITGVVQQFWSEVLWQDVDCMFVDMPPGTGDVPLTVYQSLPLDGIVIVTSPQELVEMIVGKAVGMANRMNVPVLGLVENMSYVCCPNCGEKINVFGEAHVETTAAKFGIETCVSLPINPDFAAACDAGKIESCKLEEIEMLAGKLMEA